MRGTMPRRDWVLVVMAVFFQGLGILKIFATTTGLFQGFPFGHAQDGLLYLVIGILCWKLRWKETP